MDKKQLRSQMRLKKQAMTPEEIRRRSEILAQMLRKTEVYQACTCVYGYYPMNQEVDMHLILERAKQDGKRLALPWMDGKQLRFVLVEDLTQIRKNEKGIPEPIADGPLADDPHGLVILPGLAFDRQGNRLGYGGGYYDRFLEREPEHPTIALCYDFQVVDRLEPQPHDIPAQLVLWA